MTEEIPEVIKPRVMWLGGRRVIATGEVRDGHYRLCHIPYTEIEQRGARERQIRINADFVDGIRQRPEFIRYTPNYHEQWVNEARLS